MLYRHERNLANNIGGAKLTVGIRNFILRRIQIWERGKLVPKNVSFSFTFFCLFFYLPLFNSVTKKTIPRLKKDIEGGGEFAPLTSPKLHIYV
jgi:hypothetical protein